MMMGMFRGFHKIWETVLMMALWVPLVVTSVKSPSCCKTLRSVGLSGLRSLPLHLSYMAGNQGHNITNCVSLSTFKGSRPLQLTEV
ncbi:unnamed protein product [Merluccius merluccius]